MFFTINKKLRNIYQLLESTGITIFPSFNQIISNRKSFRGFSINNQAKTRVLKLIVSSCKKYCIILRTQKSLEKK